MPSRTMARPTGGTLPIHSKSPTAKGRPTRRSSSMGRVGSGPTDEQHHVRDALGLLAREELRDAAAVDQPTSAARESPRASSSAPSSRVLEARV